MRVAATASYSPSRYGTTFLVSTPNPVICCWARMWSSRIAQEVLSNSLSLSMRRLAGLSGSQNRFQRGPGCLLEAVELDAGLTSYNSESDSAAISGGENATRGVPCLSVSSARLSSSCSFDDDCPACWAEAFIACV